LKINILKQYLELSMCDLASPQITQPKKKAPPLFVLPYHRVTVSWAMAQFAAAVASHSLGTASTLSSRLSLDDSTKYIPFNQACFFQCPALVLLPGRYDYSIGQDESVTTGAGIERPRPFVVRDS
jgi:hypothetical protein